MFRKHSSDEPNHVYKCIDQCLFMFVFFSSSKHPGFYQAESRKENTNKYVSKQRKVTRARKRNPSSGNKRKKETKKDRMPHERRFCHAIVLRPYILHENSYTTVDVCYAVAELCRCRVCGCAPRLLQFRPRQIGLCTWRDTQPPQNVSRPSFFLFFFLSSLLLLALLFGGSVLFDTMWGFG